MHIFRYHTIFCIYFGDVLCIDYDGETILVMILSKKLYGKKLGENCAVKDFYCAPRSVFDPRLLECTWPYCLPIDDPCYYVDHHVLDGHQNRSENNVLMPMTLPLPQPEPVYSQ